MNSPNQPWRYIAIVSESIFLVGIIEKGRGIVFILGMHMSSMFEIDATSYSRFAGRLFFVCPSITMDLFFISMPSKYSFLRENVFPSSHCPAMADSEFCGISFASSLLNRYWSRNSMSGPTSIAVFVPRLVLSPNFILNMFPCVSS